MELRVRWEIDVDADSPLEAAQKALDIQRRPNSTATVFDVHEHGGGKKLASVDLSEEPGQQVVLAGADAETGLSESRVFCQYDNPYGAGPVMVFALVGPEDEARWRPWRELLLKSNGASEAFWPDTQTPVFFVEGSWDEKNGYGASFEASTGLPAAFFDHLEEKYNASDMEAMRFYLKDVDADTVFTRLGEAAQDHLNRSLAPVTPADGVKVTGAGDVVPLSEYHHDDGKIDIMAVTLPGPNGHDLVEVLHFDQLDLDAETSGPKP